MDPDRPPRVAFIVRRKQGIQKSGGCRGCGGNLRPVVTLPGVTGVKAGIAERGFGPEMMWPIDLRLACHGGDLAALQRRECGTKK